MSESVELKQNEFKGWAIVEVMGHQRHIGFVDTQVFGGAVLFRVDSPEIESETSTLETAIYTGERIPAGATVRRETIPAATVLLGASSIYRITPCTEELARKAIRLSVTRSLTVLALPEAKQLSVSFDLPVDDDDEAGEHFPDAADGEHFPE